MLEEKINTNVSKLKVGVATILLGSLIYGSSSCATLRVQATKVHEEMQCYETNSPESKYCANSAYPILTFKF